MREVDWLARPFNFVGQLGGGLSIAVPSDPARIAEAEVFQLADHEERATLYAGKVDEESGLFSSGDEYLRVSAASTAAFVFHDTCWHVFPSRSALLALLQHLEVADSVRGVLHSTSLQRRRWHAP